MPNYIDGKLLKDITVSRDMWSAEKGMPLSVSKEVLLSFLNKKLEFNPIPLVYNFKGAKPEDALSDIRSIIGYVVSFTSGVFGCYANVNLIIPEMNSYPFDFTGLFVPYIILKHGDNNVIESIPFFYMHYPNGKGENAFKEFLVSICPSVYGEVRISLARYEELLAYEEKVISKRTLKSINIF